MRIVEYWRNFETSLPFVICNEISCTKLIQLCVASCKSNNRSHEKLKKRVKRQMKWLTSEDESFCTSIIYIDRRSSVQWISFNHRFLCILPSTVAIISLEETIKSCACLRRPRSAPIQFTFYSYIPYNFFQRPFPRSDASQSMNAKRAFKYPRDSNESSSILWSPTMTLHDVLGG